MPLLYMLLNYVTTITTLYFFELVDSLVVYKSEITNKTWNFKLEFLLDDIAVSDSQVLILFLIE